MSALQQWVVNDLCGAAGGIVPFSWLCDPLAYQFMWRGLWTALFVGLLCGVVGCFIILRRMALMGDAISHAVLPGVAAAYLLQIEYFWGAVASGVLTALAISFVSQHSRIKPDAAMGILFTGAFALGLVMISLVRTHVDLFHILFGNVLGVRPSDLNLTLLVGALVLLAIVVFYRPLVMIAFDRVLAQSIGLRVGLFDYLLMLLLSLTVVAALQTVGIILVVAMLIIPGSTAHLLTDRLPAMLAIAATVGSLASMIGMYLAFYLNASSGGTIVLTALLLFILAFLFAPGRGVITRWWRRRRHGLPTIAALLALTLVAAGCGFGGDDGIGDRLPLYDRQPLTGEKPLQLVATFSVVADITAQVAGDRAEIYSVIPRGDNPHEYEIVPSDAIAAEQAHAVIGIGLGLELWLDRLTADLPNRPDVIRLGEAALDAGVEPIRIQWGEQAGRPDPHIWLNPENVAVMAEILAERLSALDPEGAAAYRENAAAFRRELADLQQWAQAQFDALPVAPEQRVLITSEEAFHYFAAAFGLTHHGIWPINAHESGTPQQIVRIVELIRTLEVPALFIETSVDPRPMEQVAAETGVPIGERLLTDSLSEIGRPGDTYIGMIETNVERIVAGFGAALE